MSVLAQVRRGDIQAAYGTIGYELRELATPNLIAYWRLDESSGTIAEDIKASFDGTYHNVTLGDPGATSDSDEAALFNGTSSYVELPTGVPIVTYGAITFEAWMKTSDPTKNNQTIFDVGGASVIYNVSGDRKVHYKNTVTFVDVVSSVAINDTNWHHIAVTAGPATSAPETIYQDNIVVAVATTYAPNASTGVKAIGANASGTSNFFKGDLDEAAIYSRQLSVDEIAIHWAAR